MTQSTQIKLTRQDLKDFLVKHDYHNKKEVTITRSIASKWDLKDLCCFVALQTMEFGRPIDKSIENAECWSKHGKEEILQSFFSKDPEEGIL